MNYANQIRHRMDNKENHWGYEKVTFHLKELDGYWVWLSDDGKQSGPKFCSKEDAQDWAKAKCVGSYVAFP